MSINMNKTRKILPLAFSTLALMLYGCGGESANITPEKYDDNTTVNGACLSTMSGCLEFALDYPLQGLNFYCADDTTKPFKTALNIDNGVATGACKTGQKISFFIQGEKDRQIELGEFPISRIGNVTATAHFPRLTILDIAEGIKGSTSNNGLSSEAIAIRLVQMIQAIGLNNNELRSATEIYPVMIDDGTRKALDKLEKNISAEQIKTMSDAEFDALLATWLGPKKISKPEAEQVLNTLLNIANAAVYQPEFSLLSSDSLSSYISGSEGLVGCSHPNRECSLTDNSLTHILGHFILMTDRQGMTFGSGLQWKGKIQGTPQNPLDYTTIGGLNAHLIRSIKPVQMTAEAQSNWIDAKSKRIAAEPGYLLKIGQSNAEYMKIEQGRLFNDYMIAGKARFYNVLTGKKIDQQLTEAEQRDLGLWMQTGGESSFAGTMDLYKLYPITHLDRRVFKTQDNVQSKESYFFPLYADLKFSFNSDPNRQITLGIVIDENGDIRTNRKPAANLASGQNECSANYDPASLTTRYSLQDSQSVAVQQYRIGTISRAFIPTAVPKTTDNTLSVRMVLANEELGDLNGALIGMNSTITTSNDGSSESIVVGGALVNVNKLLNVRVNADGSNSPAPTVSLIDSEGNTVKWANSFASFNQIYSTQNTTDEESKELAKLAGGDLSLTLADCYRVKVKS